MRKYNRTNISLARTLRKNMTRQEKKLWYEFLRTYAIRFQRQKAIGEYIADFYCAKARLVIELDGSGHFEPRQIQKDSVRTQYLEQQGLTVLRIGNSDIDRNFPGVCEWIDHSLKIALNQHGIKID